MKREELARILTAPLQDCMLSAYRKGAEEMRERAAKCLEDWCYEEWDDEEGAPGCMSLVKTIRALPLTDDTEEAAYRQQMRDMTEQDDEQGESDEDARRE